MPSAPLAHMLTDGLLQAAVLYRPESKTKGAGAAVSVPLPVRRFPVVGQGHSPVDGFFILYATRPGMDKDSKEALQVAKELTAKFIETRTVSPGNFAEVFPAVYCVVCEAIRQGNAQIGRAHV